MTGTPGALVPNSKAGIEKVLNENYAFFAESTTIDYVVQRNCELTQVGGWLNSIGYGIALPEGNVFGTYMYLKSSLSLFSSFWLDRRAKYYAM